MTTLSEYLQRTGGRINEDDPPDVIKQVQQGLLRSGAQLVDDGDWGPITEAAVQHFQLAHNMPPVGWIGGRTAAALDGLLDAIPVPDKDPILPAPSVLKGAPWLSFMRAITGTKELPGEADSPTIMLWAGAIGKAFPEMASYCKQYRHDATPWCGLAMAYVMAKAGVRPVFGSTDTERFLYARAWASWGTACDPTPGCIMVFSRLGGGHVSLLEKVEGSTFYIRGGNQTDMVNVIKKTKDASFVGSRWPSNVAMDKTIVSDISNAVGEGSLA